MITKSNQEKQQLKCYHCGDDCKDDAITLDDKFFCCNGCRTVFEILQENDLCEYYRFEDTPGVSQKEKSDQEKYAFLDNQQIKNRLLDFSSPELDKVTLNIPKIHCSSCIWLLENLDRITPGIIISRVNFIKKNVSIDYDPQQVSLKEIAQLLAQIGYEPNIKLEDKKNEQSRKEKQSIYLKLGIAGFCFGNIMLLSFPDYLGVDFLLEDSLKPFFSVLNIILALPIVFYAANDYFISAWKGLRQKYINIDVPIALGIFTLFVRSLYDIIIVSHAGYLDSLAGLVFFLLIGKWFQSKSYESLSFERDYKSYFPLAVTKVEGSESHIVPVYEIKKGDLIQVRNKEIIPCDGILRSDQASIDYSFVTGESKQIPLDKGSYIYAGGRQIGQRILIKVEKEISQSYLTQLWNHDSFQKERTLISQMLINRISKYFTSAVLLIAMLALIYWLFIDVDTAFAAFTAVLIVACPCALALSVPFTYGTVTRILGRNNFYLKNTDIIEFLNKTDHIVFDKTGTLTSNESSKSIFHGNVLSEDEKLNIASITANSTHPLSKQVFNELNVESTKDLPKLKYFREESGAGIEAKIQSDTYKIGSEKFVEASSPVGQSFENQSLVYVSKNGKMLGQFVINHNFRPELTNIIHQLGHNYALSVLSGDNDYDKKYLQSIFPEGSQLIFNQVPENKLQYIENLQNHNKRVLMVGDGLNDAGALKQSNVGIALVEDITAFSPASDIIMEASSLTKLPDLLRFAYKAKLIIIISFIISFLYNLVGMGFAVTGKLEPVIAAILMPVSSVSVVAFASISVNFIGKLKKLI